MSAHRRPMYGPGAGRTPRAGTGSSGQPPFFAVAWMLPRTCFGSPVTAVPIVCWTCVLTLAHTVSLGYCTALGSAFRNGPKTGSEARDVAADVVAGSSLYSLSNWTWYLSW